ncbi:MAG TPA: hypothetical protein PLN96_17020 [Zoogloea sp.]|uniref:hypothetical protein n=1 Tax=Zoogloea sp. TaxID=49181 RepID=UPI002B9271C6|nr:hypothetical protein [Zoogloea sp.]HMV19587.1 hypothetical protein [Rhodocyclaceae bacterium]HMV65068.1 hypothetical protein [Rhodocyclaceae bacterium]HMW53792.1 hypothetical protein [Rhodocyclaceae bacterium]HMZ77721.1 hypothetical protein [Rhodocyclaceae bacterium]HNA69217.1 hypothetical protein [Rhodocyclaceae bacterium]
MKNTTAIFALLLAGCASTGVVPVAHDEYTISKQSAAGMLGSPNGVKADIYDEAHAFCTQQGKDVETVALDLKHAIPFVQPGSASLKFKCVAKS